MSAPPSQVTESQAVTGSADPTSGSPSRSFMTIYYAVLVLLTAAVVAFSASAGSGRHAEPTIAGGYDVSSGTGCLGSKFDLEQSGQFVDLSSSEGPVAGSLTLKRGHLSGQVTCVNHAKAPLSARFSGGNLEGGIAGQTMVAQLKRDPPPAGAPKPLAPGSIAGTYALAPSSACLGAKLVIDSSGSLFKLVAGQVARGNVSYRRGTLAGTVSCSHGGQRLLSGTASGRALDLMLIAPAAAAGAGTEHLSATLARTPDQTVVAFFLAALVVMLFARLCGSVMPKLGQPRVMGEVLAGIILGPTLFGAIDPGLQSKIFSSDIVPFIGVAANLGLIFYMFLIGLEVDLDQVRGRVGMTLAISNTSLLVPAMMGMAVAVPLYSVLAPSKRFLAFALFITVSMSVTAFPVLARIVSERRMLKRPLGIIAISAAALNDVSAWFLIALATAVAGAGTGLDVLRTIGWTLLFGVAMAFAVRPLLARAAVAYDEAGRVPGTWITIIFAGVLLAAVTTDKIGVAVIFGAFVMGLAMPRHAGLSEEVTKRVEDFVLTLLLPLFFAYTGLRTNVGLLGRPELILITLGLVAVAIGGKYGGTLIAARAMRLPWRESAVLGALMNTRGLTELIVLNLALDQGVISPALFTALVVMALITTLMTGPILRLIDPRNRFGSPPEEELAGATRISVEPSAEAPTRSILVAPQSDSSLEPLLALAAPLARSEPPRELVLVRLVRPPRGSAVRGGLQSEAHEVRAASDLAQRARLGLLDQGIAARAAALSSVNPGADLARLAQGDEIDLVLMDGRRPLLGDGVPREEVGTVLNSAPCDVAVLVAREGSVVVPGPGAVVTVPFGGAEHDWAALELAAWMCAATGASLELLGPPGQTDEGKDAGHMLANAALLVQQFAGVAASSVVAQPGRHGIVAAASHADLLFIGLSERWQKEGLGETRKAIARAAPAPIVFVRRGVRPGALSPAADATRFGWSSPGLDGSRVLSRAFSHVSMPGVRSAETTPSSTDPPEGPDTRG
jgi:Kef-type K+ transport system membrane component KefB